MNPGIHRGITHDNYHEWPFADYSLLKYFLRSAAHARAKMLSPRAPTMALDFGGAYHALVLEGAEVLDQRYAQRPVEIDRRTKAGKIAWEAFERANAGKTVLARSDWSVLHEMATALHRNPVAHTLLTERGVNELSIVWDRKVGDAEVRCKVRLDRLTDALGFPASVDLKTCEDARPGAFERSVYYYSYHMQAALYLDAVAAFHPDADRRFLIVAQEKDPPYESQVYEVEAGALDQGRDDYERALAALVLARSTGDWPGYPREVKSLGLPSWAYRNLEV